MERYFSTLRRGKATAFLELGRPWNATITAIVLVVSALILNGSSDYTFVFLGALTMFFGYIGGTTINDVIDSEADQINMPYRPIPKKVITKNEAILFAVIAYGISLVAAWNVNLPFFFVGLAYMILGVAYSAPPLNFENKGIIGQISLALITGFLPAFGGAIIAHPLNEIPFAWWMAFTAYTLLFAAVLIFKDFKDVKGDQIAGKKTFVLQVGKKPAYYAGLIGIALGYPLAIYTFNTLFLKPGFLVLGAVLAFVTFFTASQVEKNPEKTFAKLRLLTLGLLIVISASALNLIP